MDFFYRTEDIRPEDIGSYFVETNEDRNIINQLKQRTPVILVGSRGAGKSFLLRMAQQELAASFSASAILPVYVSFNRSSLIRTNDPDQFRHWMLARLCHFLLRAINKTGLMINAPQSISAIAGGFLNRVTGSSKIESILDSYETSWNSGVFSVDASGIPTVDDMIEAAEDICESLSLNRISFFIDEAAHVLIPEQQRSFFTLFRDLRSPNLACNAAVYPGLTSYGDTFQPSHDATILTLDRNLLSSNYVESMRDIVEKQAEQSNDDAIIKTISQNNENFAILAYAASGNPRTLLKTLAKAPKVNSSQVNNVIREYYRTDIWSDHTNLGENYIGHKPYIDWGRNFIEDIVLPEIKRKNDQYLPAEKNTSAFFWIHRDSPQSIKEALRLLAYTGIVSEHANGIRATRAEIGTRYIVNIGCLMALESAPASNGLGIARSLTPKRMTEYGENHDAYKQLANQKLQFDDIKASTGLESQLSRSLAVLDIPVWQITGLKSIGLHTLRDVLQADENKYQEIYMVGYKRSRRIRNAAMEAVFEYLSG